MGLHKKIFHKKHSKKAGVLVAAFALAGKFTIASKIAAFAAAEHHIENFVSGFIPENSFVEPWHVSVGCALFMAGLVGYVGHLAHKTVSHHLHN